MISQAPIGVFSSKSGKSFHDSDDGFGAGCLSTMSQHTSLANHIINSQSPASTLHSRSEHTSQVHVQVLPAVVFQGLNIGKNAEPTSGQKLDETVLPRFTSIDVDDASVNLGRKNVLNSGQYDLIVHVNSVEAVIDVVIATVVASEIAYVNVLSPSKKEPPDPGLMKTVQTVHSLLKTPGMIHVEVAAQVVAEGITVIAAKSAMVVAGVPLPPSQTGQFGQVPRKKRQVQGGNRWTVPTFVSKAVHPLKLKVQRTMVFISYVQAVTTFFIKVVCVTHQVRAVPSGGSFRKKRRKRWQI